jgi:colicin import membrane protein
MKTRIDASAYAMGAGIDSRTMMFYLIISLIVHLVFFGSVVFFPQATPRPRLGQGAINVSLVSLPGQPKAAPAPAPAAAPKPAAKAIPVPKQEMKPPPKVPVVETPPPKPLPVLPKPDKTVSLAPQKQKRKVKKSLKKKTQNRKKMIDQALSGVQKKVETSQPDSVRQALDRLKKKVAQSEAEKSGSAQAVKEIPGATGTGASGSGGRRALELADLYKVEVAFQVERHWAFSHQVAGDGRTLQAKLIFRVLPNGEITDIRFTQKSGNSYLDDSAYRAIVKANPVPPHPAGIRLPYVTVGLSFTPEGLRR